MKAKLLRLIAVFLTVVFSVSSLSVVLPTIMALNSTEKTPVLPFTPLNANGIGGTKTEVKENKNLFFETASVVISSDTQLQGIISEIPPKDTTPSPVMKITPMVSGSAITYNYATVTHSFEKTIDLTEEKGLKITTISGNEYLAADTSASQAYSNIAFAKRNNFVDADVVMFYLKIDSANIVAPNFAAFVPETVGRWKYDFDPVLMLMVGKEYSYRTLDSDTWTTTTAIQDKAGSLYFGAMKFDTAFEGYVKIPLESLGNDLGFKFKPNQDSFKLMCVRAKSLGGTYGSMTAGPYFVVNKDSTSTNMEVNDAAFSAAPANIGAKVSGFKEPLKNADALLIYAKTDSANRISVSANMWDDYLSDIPSLVLRENATVYTAVLGTDKWTETKTVETEADGAVQFDSAFEGYIKIPISSLKEQEASPFIAIYPEIDHITGVEVSAAGIGGKFGNVEVVPFLINDDKNTASFILSDEYKPPVASATEVEPVMNSEILLNNWQTVTHTEVKPLDYTNATGTLMSAKAAGGYVQPNLNSSQAYANFKLDNLSLNGYEGLVFYVKVGSENLVMPQIALNIPEDSTRWKYSWDPILAITVGKQYEYLSLSDSEWQVGTAVADVSGNKFFGAIKFDGAFEGYIKIPFTSLDNDSGYIMLTELDSVKNIVYRINGLGGDYGQVTIGPTMFVTKDGAAGIKLKDADPIIVNPVTEWVSDQTAVKSIQTVVTPLDWTTAKGLKISANSEYTYDYPATSLAYARFKTNDNFTLGDTTHVIWYIKTDSANTVLPRIVYSGASLNMSYDPEMTLGVGKTYSYLPIGGDKWISATSVPTWKNNNGVNNTYFGGMKFDGPFEGYVKIAVADLSNDYAKVNKADRATTKISNFIVSTAKIGGKYGSVTAGPILLTNKDSDSSVIKLYEEPNENAGVAINAVPISGTVNSKGIDYKIVNPFRGLTLQGYKLSAQSEWSVNNDKISGSANVFGINADTALKNSDRLLIYVKTDKDTVIAPDIILNKPADASRWSESEAPVMSLGVGSIYQLLSFSDIKWTKQSAVKADNSDTYNGGIELKAGFEGYISIPYTSLVNEKGFALDVGIDSIEKLEFRFGSLGNDGNTVTLGPISLITNNGEGTEVIYPASYDSADPYERIQGIFERSKQGLAQGYYYMIGDSTRHLYGYPIFRVVRNALKENFNMNCTVQALSGLKAEHWSGYTPGLDGPLFPTVEQLIEQIPGTGRNCIVDLALAINDSAKSPDKIYEFLIMGLNKIRQAKPEAVIVYTSPSLISFAKQNKNIYDAAEMVWADKSIYKIDVMKNVFDDYYSQYYVDTHHPNSLGYKLIGQYIVSQYVEGVTFDKIYDIDTSSYTLPKDSTPVKSALTVDNIYNLTAGVYSMNVNGVDVSSIKLNGSKVYTANDPFNTQNFIQTKLSENLNGSDYIAFYLKLPGANRIGLRAFTMDDNKEIIFMRDMKYYVMPLGSNEWTEKKSGAGRNDKIETYGSLDFDGGFEGWVKLPLYGFYGSPSSEDEINGVTFRFSELGGEYGEVRLGSFFKITNSFDVDSTSYTLPDNAKPITSELKVFKTYNLAAGLYNMQVNGAKVGAFIINGSKVCSGEAPFNTQNYIQTELSESLKGNDYIAFYLKLPAANRIGVRAFTMDDNKEIIFKRDMKYYVMPIGNSNWTEKVSGPGRKDGVETYGSLDFDGGFEGWVKLPLSGFYGSPSTSDDINGVTFRFSELGGTYGEVRLGAFFATSDEPYTAKNVWNKADLPIMEPLTAIGKLDSASYVYKDYIASPIPSLTENPALVIGTSPAADYEGLDYGRSIHWVSTEYNNVPIGKYSHLAFYVKVPKTKDNAFILHMWTDAKNGDNGIFQIMANSAVQLLPMGETKWQHIVTERVLNSIGGVPLPAGFEGLVKISYASMFPANRVDEDTNLSKIAYRFKYMGMGEESVIAGPVFGIIQDNDTGPDELVYTSMPEATTIKSLYQIEDCDKFVDSVMLYWEPFDGAKYYVAEAYSVTKTEKGFEYRLETSNRCVSNSGAITNLMPGRKYAVLIKAYDLNDKLLAVYDYTLVETPDTEEYTYASVSDKIKYDKVYYKDKNAATKGDTAQSVVVYLVIGSVSIVLLAGAAVVFAVIYKRRKKNA